jgi:hypothetical protein
MQPGLFPSDSSRTPIAAHTGRLGFVLAAVRTARFPAGQGRGGPRTGLGQARPGAGHGVRWMVTVGAVPGTTVA